MNIEKISKTKSFGSIEQGEVFTYQGNYYMKTETYSGTINAVELNTGVFHHFPSTEEVNKCETAILKIN